MDQLSAKEAEIYDRQIRLWGVEAQKRMRASTVLIAGMGALGAELTKNVVLAGVNTCIADGVAVEPKDVGLSFFLGEEDQGRNVRLLGRLLERKTTVAACLFTHFTSYHLQRAAASLSKVAELNPLVNSRCIEKSPSALSDEELKAFQCVILCGLELAEQVALCERCHNLKVPVIAALQCGYWGFFFVDVGHHQYIADLGPQSNASAAAPRAVSVNHHSLREAMARPWLTTSTKATRPGAYAYMAMLHAASSGDVRPGLSALELEAVLVRHATRLLPPASGQGKGVDDRGKPLPLVSMQYVAGALSALAASYGHEFLPVATVLGGVLGNEVLKVLTGKGEPVRNTYVYDAMGGTGGNINTF